MRHVRGDTMVFGWIALPHERRQRLGAMDGARRDCVPQGRVDIFSRRGGGWFMLMRWNSVVLFADFEIPSSVALADHPGAKASVATWPRSIALQFSFAAGLAVIRGRPSRHCPLSLPSIHDAYAGICVGERCITASLY